MGKLLQPDFDQANFLYSMYKSCTMDEIEDFKASLEDVRDGTVKAATQNMLTSQSADISQMAKYIINIEE